MQREAAFSQYGASANTEMLAAVAAPISHWLVIFALVNVQAATVATMGLTIPAVVLEIEPRAFLIREAIEKLKGAKGFWLVHVT